MKKSFFTPEEMAKFKKLYPVTMNNILSELFGLDDSQLRSRARYYGVRKTPALIKQAQSLARIGKKHIHHRRHQPVEETVDPEGLCIPTAHGIKAITQHACGTTTVHRIR